MTMGLRSDFKNRVNLSATKEANPLDDIEMEREPPKTAERVKNGMIQEKVER